MSEEKLMEAINYCNIPELNTSIGIQNEKILHRIMKYYINFNQSCHEVKIGRIYADVVIDTHIYEIQTANFNMLRKKLDYLLTDYEVTIVYPTSRNKKIYKINENGEYISEVKSPKKKTPLEILVEMYKIKSYLNNPNLSFKVVYMDMDEFRTIVPKKHFRSKGYARLKQVPTSFVKEYNFNTKLDYINVLKEYNLPYEFTTKEITKYLKISSSKASKAVQVLNALGVVNLVGKKGHSNLWRY